MHTPTPRRGFSAIPRYDTNRAVLGLPANAVVISNSERTDAACDLRWFYRYGLGLTSAKVEVPLSFGQAAHDAMEDVWGWWARTDAAYDARWFEECVWCVLNIDQTPGEPCPKCGGSCLGPVPRAIQKWERDAAANAERFGAEDEDENEDLPKRSERLRRVMDGYLRTYGNHPPGDLRVIGVEVPVARQILGPNGKPYAPEIPVYRADDGGFRFARPGDDPARVSIVKMPWYYIGTLDVVLASRATGMLFVGEHKFSKAPETFLQGLTNDPQTPGYCWALEAVADALTLPPEIQAAIDAHGGKRRVGGYLYMVNSSSYQHDPEPLKAGGLSVAKNRTVPSWRFEAALANALAADPANPKLQPAVYADHIADLRSRIDPRLYRREPGSVGAVEKARFGREMYAIATRHARMRREVWKVTPANPVEGAFPRTPVCRIAGGTCSFRGPCASRTTAAPDVTASGHFLVTDGQRWFPDGEPSNPLPLPAPAATPTTPENPPCLF